MELVTIAPGHQLAPAPAAAWARAAAAGCPQTITWAYRPPELQADWRADYLRKIAAGQHVAYVAPVALSEHVTGYALDLKDPAIAWHRAHPEYGFVFTDPTERWHVAYRIGRDQHLSSASTPPPPPAAAAPTKDEDDMRILLARTPDGTVWAGDGITRRALPDQVALADLRYRIQTGVLPGEPGAPVHEEGRVEWLGVWVK